MEEVVLNAELVKDFPGSVTEQILDTGRPVVERGYRRENRRTCQRHRLHVAEVDERQRRFSWHEDQSPTLLEAQISCSGEQAF